VIRVAAALAVGVVLAVPHAATARTGVDALSLEQQVGQVVVLSFSGGMAPDVHAMFDETRAAI
jgi:RPA family protein